MIEVELKAELLSEALADLRGRLAARSSNVSEEEYEDIYFDDLSGSLESTERELRLRERQTPNGDEISRVLTYKGSPVDNLSKSKLEIEVKVESVDRMQLILGELGYHPTLGYRKSCVNYSLEFSGKNIAATVVVLPEIQRHFLEIETQVNSMEQFGEAMNVLKQLLEACGVEESSLNAEYYTDMIRKYRDQ